MSATDQVRPEDAGRLGFDEAHSDAAVLFYQLSGKNGALANELRKKHEFVTEELFKSYAHAVQKRERQRAQDFAETLFMIEHGAHRFDNVGIDMWDEFIEALGERAAAYTQGLHEEQIASAGL